MIEKVYFTFNTVTSQLANPTLSNPVYVNYARSTQSSSGALSDANVFSLNPNGPTPIHLKYSNTGCELQPNFRCASLDVCIPQKQVGERFLKTYISGVKSNAVQYYSISDNFAFLCLHLSVIYLLYLSGAEWIQRLSGWIRRRLQIGNICPAKTWTFAFGVTELIACINNS